MFDQLTGLNMNNPFAGSFNNSLQSLPLGTNDPSPIWGFPHLLSPGTPSGYNPNAPHLSQFDPVPNIYSNPNFFNNSISNFNQTRNFLGSIQRRFALGVIMNEGGSPAALINVLSGQPFAFFPSTLSFPNSSSFSTF